jgi:formylglycine-generating enzyme required for sulfatase activity
VSLLAALALGAFPVGCGAASEMVAVRAGTFSPRIPNDPPLAERVSVAAFHLDATEVTAAAYGACVARGRCTAAAAGEGCTSGRPETASHPVSCVTPAQAEAYCASLGKRLPSEIEWAYAAHSSTAGEGPLGALDPTGNLWEITATRASLNPLAGLPEAPDEAPSAPGVVGFVIRGGGRSETGPRWARAVAWRIIAPDTAEARIGFRCAR